MGWLLRRWLWLTKKADKSTMIRQLGLQMKLYQAGERSTKTGKTLKFKGGWKVRGAGRGNIRSKNPSDAGKLFPLIVAIIQKRKGGSPYKGKSRAAGRRAMAKAVKRKAWFRQRSIAYLKSGIASAQKPFLKFSSGSTGVPQDNDPLLKPVGRPKGFGTIATPGNQVMAIAISKTNTRKQGDRGLMKFALPALHKAYADELADTVRQLEIELTKTARRVGVKVR